MPNNNAPFGFRPYAKLDGSAPNFALEPFTILSSDANTYFTGDVVALSTAAGFLGTLAPYSSANTGVAVPQGIFRGCEFFSAQVGRTTWSSYYPGSVGSSSPCTAYVITDPDLLYSVQVSSGALTTTSKGQLRHVVTVTGGNTVTGISGMTLDTSAPASQISSAAYALPMPFKIWDTYGNISALNATQFGGDDTANFNIVIVKPNAFARTFLAGQST